MGQDRQIDAGLFVGVDKEIRCALGLKEGKHLRQLTTCREVACRPVPPDVDVLVGLVRQLYRLVCSNLGDYKPSAENWRWERQTFIEAGNKSPEVVLERAVALLAEQRHLAKWCNQIPVASGLIDDKLDKPAAVDLARIEGDRLDLYELKWKSDTPIHAAFGILRYGLAYLLCRVNQKKFGYTDLDTMQVNALGLNVLAPLPYYKKLDLTWLQTGLDAGIRTVAQDIRRVSQEQLGPDFRASFQFLVLPVEPTDLFANGAEARAACGATPLAPKAVALVQAMGKLRPLCPTPDSV